MDDSPTFCFSKQVVSTNIYSDGEDMQKDNIQVQMLYIVLSTS
jgi:hypothetical protein